MSENIYQIKEAASHANNFDRALMFKMACNDEDELNSLLTYYRDRINDFDKERTEWLEKLEDVRISQEEKHKLDWELQKRKDEIAELQKTITEQKVALFDERQMVLKLQRENDLLKIKEVEDRKKIAELLSLTEPIEEEIVLTKDLRPEITHKYVKNDLNIHQNRDNFEHALKKMGQPISSNSTFACSGKGGRSVVKTIYLPNENLNQVAMQNEQLNKQLELERTNFLGQVQTLKEELAIRDDEMKIRYNADQEKITQLEKHVQKLKDQHLALTKDYFSLRMRCNDSEQRLHEENELLRLRNTALANKLVIVQKQSEVENRASRELVEKRSDEYTNKFRNELKVKEENLQVMKNQYAQAQKIYLGKVRDLENNLTKLTEKYYQLEKRKNLEIEGLKHESTTLRRKLEEVENYEMNFQNLQSQKEAKQKLKESKQEQIKTKKKLQAIQEREKIYGKTSNNNNKKSFQKKQKSRREDNEDIEQDDEQLSEQQQSNEDYKDQSEQISSDKHHKRVGKNIQKDEDEDQEQEYQNNDDQDNQQQEDEDLQQEEKENVSETVDYADLKKQLEDLEKNLDAGKNNNQL